MRLSCLPVSYFSQIIHGDMSVAQWAWQAKEVGLDAIDLSVLLLPDRDPQVLRSTRDEIRSAGLRVAMITTYPDFTHPDAEERARQAALLEEDLKMAGIMGAEMVRVTAGQAHPETGRSQGIDWAIEGLTNALAAASEQGVQLVFENHSKPGVWEYSDFSWPTDIFLSIVQGTAGTALGVNFDTANTLSRGDDPALVLEQVLDRVVSLHVSDTCSRTRLEPVVIGTGLVPFSEVFGILRGAGFAGWLCIEEASNTGRAGVEAAVSFVRRAWAEWGT